MISSSTTAPTTRTARDPRRDRPPRPERRSAATRPTRAQGQGRRAQPRLPLARRADRRRRPRRVIVAIVDADGRLAPDGAGATPPPTSPTRRSAGSSRWSASTTASGCSPGSRTSSSPSTATSTRPAAPAGARRDGRQRQFNRLSALDEVADEERPVARPADRGPGPRAAADRPPAGRAARSCARTVDQQGLSTAAAAVPPAHPLVPGQPAGDGAAPASVLARAGPGRRPDRAARLPADAVLAGDHRPRAGRRDRASRSPASRRSGAAAPGWQLAFFYLLGFGGTMLGCIAAPHRPRGCSAGSRGFLIAPRLRALHLAALAGARALDACARSPTAATGRRPSASR